VPRRGRLNGSELHDVYREHVGAVYAFLGYSVAPHVAEDLTSATFERVVRSWGSYDARKASERTWILFIARNILTDHFRRQSHRAGPSLDEHPALLDRLVAADDPLAQHLRLESARGWLEQLGPREREVLALRYGADLTAADIAKALELSEDNVHQICSRALRRLRRAAAEEDLTRNA
jgi:RNA polymerase sigma-70 factor (ECF subfamily)